MSLPEALSLASTPSVKVLTPSTVFATSFADPLNDRYQELQNKSNTLHSDWNTILAKHALFAQQFDISRLHNWALNRPRYRHDIHEDIQEDNIKILSQQSLILEFETTVNLSSFVHHPLSLSQPELTLQSLSIYLYAQN